MIKLGFEFRIVPFSSRLIKDHRLHITDEEDLGGSSILMMLDGELESRTPQRMAVCYANGTPVGAALVFLVHPGDNWMLAYDDDDERDSQVHGFLNVYVARAYRCRGIGKILLDLSMQDFSKTYPLVKRVMVSRILKGKFGKYESAEPVYASIGNPAKVTLLHRITRRDLIARSTPELYQRAFFGRT